MMIFKMNNKFLMELDVFLLDNPNCSQEDREDIIEWVNKNIEVDK